MAGTILKQLVAVGQTDGTAVTTGNSGFSSLNTGGGNTITHEDDAKMGQPAGYRMTQAAGNANVAYLDLVSAVGDVLTFRGPFAAPTPGANVAVLRFYPDNTHVTNLGTVTFTTTRRIQFVEGGTGGLNLTTPSGTPYVAASPYVMQVKIGLVANTFELAVFPVGSTTPLATLSGALAADMAAAAGIQSARWGIGTASALTYLDTNSGFALGSGDWLPRHDIPLVIVPISPSTVRPLDMITVPITLASGDAPDSISINQNAGPTVAILPTVPANPAQRRFRAPATVAGTTVVLEATATVGGTTSPPVTITYTVRPHETWLKTISGWQAIREQAITAVPPGGGAAYGAGPYGN